MKRYFQFFILIFAATVFAGCAQIGTLTGGDKDSLPPVMLAGNPAMFDTSFKGTKLVIVFDEFFDLKNPEDEFYASPPLEKKPEFKIKKRRLIIKIDEKLRDATTYSFCFGDAVKDFHENNAIKNFKYIFSTGTTVDSLAVSGRILDAFSHKPLKKGVVMLYNSFEDSVPLKQKPLYISRTDTLGFFNCDFIKEGKYKLFVINDLNANLLYDIPEENIAFCDSILIPKVEKEIVYDTFKIEKDNPDKSDPKKLKIITDSIVVKTVNLYQPGDLRFFSFPEDRLKQFLKSKERQLPGKCVFVYNKPIENPQINIKNWQNPKILNELNKTKDTLIVWIPDSTLYKSDTLFFSDSWKNVDSLQHLVDEKEDFKLVFSKPKEDEKKSKKKKIALNLLNINFPGSDIDINKNYFFSSESPIAKLEPSKFQFFTIYDTLVHDAKKQELLKSQRTSFETIFLTFKRPVSEFNLIPLNFKVDTTWFSAKFNQKRDSVFCTLFQKNIIAKDTLKILVKYDNDFYLNRMQEFEDTLILPVISQKIVSIERSVPEIIKMKFEKAPGTNFQVNITDNNASNWFQFIHQPFEETAVLKIINPDIAIIDSFEINFKIPDKTLADGTVQYFESSADAVFAPEKQFIKSAKRTEKNKIVFAFNSHLESMPTITPLNFPTDNSNFQTTINSDKDTFVVTINDKSVFEKDTLKIKITFPLRNSKKIIELQSESSILPVDMKAKNAPHTKKNDKGEIPVSIELPVEFDIVQDSSFMRKYHIKQNLKPGKKYLLKIDSNAVYDIFGNKNAKISQTFTVRELKYYGKITIKLKQIAAPTFPGFNNKTQNDADSLLFSKITKGQIIVNLTDIKGNPIRQKSITSDSTLIFDELPPKDYQLFLIYDTNDNGKWDTGDYLKKQQAESTLYYRKPVAVKSKFDSQIDWIIKYED